MKRPIYLDNMATTPVDPRVVAKMSQFLGPEDAFGNPASKTHAYGWQAQEAVDLARNQVASAINADVREIIFTSGATESINLALKGASFFYQRQGKHIITLATEHKAVLDTCQFLQSQGFEVTYLPVQTSGLLDLNQLETALRRETILVSILQVNNEIGVMQDIPAIAALTRKHGVLLHVDGAQSIGKVAVDVHQLGVDLMSFSAHKAYGPKGVGALFVLRQPKVHLQPLIHGGGHEQGLRAGTLATHQIVGMGEAFEIAKNELKRDLDHILTLRDQLWAGLKDLEQVRLNGALEPRVPHNLNVCFSGIDGEALMMAARALAVSSGSACTSATIEPSHVLLSLGLSRLDANSALRISLGRFTTAEDISAAVDIIRTAVKRLRHASPLWPVRNDSL